jgi:hypothetical protein
MAARNQPDSGARMRAASVTAPSAAVHCAAPRRPARHVPGVLPLGMRFLPPVACALLFALPAKADKFWLSDPAAQKNAPATSSPDVIDGVLLAEDADGYHIRIVGGEILLPKKAVFKVEKDDLSVDTIVKREKDNAEAIARADKERQDAQRVARMEREVKAVEAAAKRVARAADASAKAEPAPAPEPAFDPVLGAAPAAVDAVTAARRAYEQTGDRAYLRELRQLRRAR